MPTSNPQSTSQQPAITDPLPSASIPTSGGQTLLLKTAVATVNTGHIYCEANILFDEGVQCSFISHTLDNQLGIPPSESNSISLSAFGAQLPASRYLPVTTINSAYGKKIPLCVLVVKKIATPLQNHLHQQIKDIPNLRGLRLALPIT